MGLNPTARPFWALCNKKYASFTWAQSIVDCIEIGELDRGSVSCKPAYIIRNNYNKRFQKRQIK